MRNFLHTIAVVAALALSGCNYIFEDESNCPPPLDQTLVLHFSNTDNNGKEIFSTTIDKVEIFLFNENDRLVYYFEIPPAELKASQSITRKVKPGNYRIVCWGNAKDNTTISMESGDLINNGYVYKYKESNETLKNANPLYFAPYDKDNAQRFVVKNSDRTDVDVRFRAAHIKMDFTVIGYATVTGATSNPYIEVTNLSPKYNFNLQNLPSSPVNFIQQTGSKTKNTDITFAYFNTPRFEIDNPIVIHLRKAPLEAPIKSLTLTDELKRMEIDLSTVELTIPIEIIFTKDANGNIDANIRITQWQSGGGLKPEIQ